jgi:hypothetical protein
MQRKPPAGAVQSPPAGATHVQVSGSCVGPPSDAQRVVPLTSNVRGTVLPPATFMLVSRGSLTQILSSRSVSGAIFARFFCGPPASQVNLPETPLVHWAMQPTGMPEGSGLAAPGVAGACGVSLPPHAMATAAARAAIRGYRRVLIAELVMPNRSRLPEREPDGAVR